MGQNDSPRLLGLPLGSASTQGAAWGSVLNILLPQTQRHTALLRGMCHPSNLPEHQNLHPSFHSPSSCSLSPPIPAAPGSPQPLAGAAPGSTGCWWGVRGQSGSSQLGRVPFLPQTSSGAGCSPYTPGCDTSPYLPLPRALICPQGEPALVLAPGEAQGSLRWETPCEGWTCQPLMSCMVCFQPQARQTATITLNPPRHANTAQSELCLVYLEHIYRQK